MSEQKLYSINEAAELLGVSTWTLSFWYRCERKLIASGDVSKPYLPVPVIDVSKRGKPKFWNTKMIKELQKFKDKKPIGRHGEFGRFSNPNNENYIYKKEK